MLTTENANSLVGSLMKKKKIVLKKYVVLNKEGLPPKRAKTESQVRINGEGYKAGDELELDPNSSDAKYLVGVGWLKLAEKPKPKVELETKADDKKDSKKGKSN